MSLKKVDLRDRFDVVAFFKTAEHVRNSVQFLGRLRERVRHGGYLVIVGHDWISTVNRLMGNSSPIFDIEHLQIFSSTSLRIALDRAGATKVSIRLVWHSYRAPAGSRLHRLRFGACWAESPTGSLRASWSDPRSGTDFQPTRLAGA